MPLISDLVKYPHIRDADFNWFEAAQLLLSALVVPIPAKLGDMFGHKRILLVSTVLTAGASWALVLADSFTTFLVVALEAGAIIGALLGGRVFGWFGNSVPLSLTIPAIAVTLVFIAVLFGVPESTPLPGRRLDVVDFSMLTLGLLLITAALTNTTKTIGGSFASAIFGIVLAMGVLAVATSTASNPSGYLTLWAMCGIGALVAAVLLFFVPKLAFADVADELPAGVETAPIE